MTIPYNFIESSDLYPQLHNSDIPHSPEDYKVLCTIGDPESTNMLTEVPSVHMTLEGAIDLYNKLIAVVTPAEMEAEEITVHEVGFFPAGHREQDINGKWHLIIKRWIPVDPSIPTGRTEKPFSSDAWAKGFSEADRMEVSTGMSFTILGEGHDHHEVAKAEPSGEDIRNLLPQKHPGNTISFIFNRSRYPLGIAAYSAIVQSGEKRYVNVGGFTIIDDHSSSHKVLSMTPEAVGAEFVYYRNDGIGIHVGEDSVQTFRDFDKITKVREGFEPPELVSVDLDDGDIAKQIVWYS